MAWLAVRPIVPGHLERKQPPTPVRMFRQRSPSRVELEHAVLHSSRTDYAFPAAPVTQIIVFERNTGRADIAGLQRLTEGGRCEYLALL